MDFLQTCFRYPKILDSIFFGLELAVIITDMDGRISWTNRVVEKIFGYTQEELENQNLSLLFTREDLNLLYPNLFYMANRKRPYEGEVMLQRKNGDRFFTYMIFEPCADLRDNTSILSVCLQDIDERKRIEKKISESFYDALLEIARGLKPGLAKTLGEARMLVDELNRPGEGQTADPEASRRILERLDQIERLAASLESFASIPEPYFTDENIKDIVEEAAAGKRSQLEEKQIVVVNALEDAVLAVDRPLINRVFTILIENSAEAAAPGGRIEFRGEKVENQFVVDMIDSGPGIPTDDRPHIFEPFFSTKPDRPGMGLPIVRRIMEKHGGWVEAASEAGQGVTVALAFPMERRRFIRLSRLAE